LSLSKIFLKKLECQKNKIKKEGLSPF